MVGAIVIVAIAIVFIPIVFDEGRTRPLDIQVNIPEKPVISQVPIEKPKRPTLDVVAASKQASTTSTPKKADSSVEINTKKFDENKLPMSWSVQLATFKEQKNAGTLRDKLRKSGYKSYLKVENGKKTKLHRVFVGPELDYKRISVLQKKLKKQFKLEGFIVRFQP